MTDQPLEPDEPSPAPQAQSVPEPEAEPAPTTGEPPPPPPTSPEPERRRLFRSRNDRVLAGVCGGLGRYFGVDPVLFRIAAVVLVFAGGLGIVLYVIGWIALPEEPVGAAEPLAAGGEVQRRSGTIVLGAVFVVLGLFFLLDELWPDFLSWKYTWPFVLIAIGLAILVRGRR